MAARPSQMHAPHQKLKLPRLPPNYKVCKRPLQRTAVASPYAGPKTPKIVYISARTPIMSAVKRVRALLVEVEKRATQSVRAKEDPKAAVGQDKKSKRKSSGRSKKDEVLSEAMATIEGREDAEEGREEVFVQATGRSIEKALNVAMVLREKHGLGIRVRTGTTKAVDGIEYHGNDKSDGGGSSREDEEIPEARLRFLSRIEISVALR